MVDHVYCINLEKRRDRRATVSGEFERAGIENVELWPATDGRLVAPSKIKVSKPEYGCADSHIRIWRDVVENGYEVALVFEDDVKILPNFNLKLTQVLKELEMVPEWDYVNLGPVHVIEDYKETPMLIKGRSLMAHCYLISLKGAKKIATWEPEDTRVGIDVQIVQSPLKTYYTNEILARQEDAVNFLSWVKQASQGDIKFDRTFDYDYTIRSFIHNDLTTVVLIALMFVIVFYVYKNRK